MVNCEAVLVFQGFSFNAEVVETAVLIWFVILQQHSANSNNGTGNKDKYYDKTTFLLKFFNFSQVYFHLTKLLLFFVPSEMPD